MTTYAILKMDPLAREIFRPLNLFLHLMTTQSLLNYHAAMVYFRLLSPTGMVVSFRKTILPLQMHVPS